MISLGPWTVRRVRVPFVASASLAAILACGSEPGVSTTGSGATTETPFETTSPAGEPPSPVPNAPSASEDEARSRIAAEIERSKNLDAATFAKQYAVTFNDDLGYDPLQATNLPLIQASEMSLDADELSALEERGFTISAREAPPTFVDHYAEIYRMDLPVFVSADSILHAVHRSYDAILENLETQVLTHELAALLEGMRAGLAAGAARDLGENVEQDLDHYLAVASGLLDGPFEPVAGGDATAISNSLAKATLADGTEELHLFGVPRPFDYSQFEPRGHYTHSEALGQYFRSMMWLGRVDFRFLEPNEEGVLELRRRQLQAAYGLAALVGPEERKRWAGIHKTIGLFVGEPDYMELPQLDPLLEAIGVDDPRRLDEPSDEALAAAIQRSGLGAQRIASHVIKAGTADHTLPLSISFALFGQRYTVDSHVFSNLVHDRVGAGSIMRMMPSPLDVAFAALGNNHAGQLLAPELAHFSYAPDLHLMRFLVDEHPASYWTGSLYTRWLAALRTLSYGPTRTSPNGDGLPAVARTEAWGRRLLNTQLASWAELRHDTLLYVKQSYSGGAECEFPDAYVDPYPEFFDAIAALAEHGAAVTSDLAPPEQAAALRDYFATLQATAMTLAEMATYQRTGTPFTAAHLDFINRVVSIDRGCVSQARGWYADLFFDGRDPLQFEPTIADVHTQPFDEAGSEVGRILHVATGRPRRLVMTAATCEGPRAYVGVVSSYHELITEQYDRKSDLDWSVMLQQPADDVPWMTDLVVR